MILNLGDKEALTVTYKGIEITLTPEKGGPFRKPVVKVTIPQYTNSKLQIQPVDLKYSGFKSFLLWYQDENGGYDRT